MQAGLFQACHPPGVQQLVVEVNGHAAQPGGQLPPVIAPLIQQQPARQLGSGFLRRLRASISNDDSSGAVIPAHSSRAAVATTLPVCGPRPVVGLISIFAIMP